MNPDHIKTGRYTVKFYNHMNTEIVDLAILALSLAGSTSLGQETIKKHADVDKMIRPISFTIDRRVHSSLDERPFTKVDK